MAKTKKRPEDAGRALAVLAARIAHSRSLENIVALNLRDISPICDYFVIATGNSDRQMRGVAEEIIAGAGGIGRRIYRTAGMESARWIVLDFVDVVVHLFDPPYRSYYDLELIWGDAPRLRWRAARGKPPGKETDNGHGS